MIGWAVGMMGFVAASISLNVVASEVFGYGTCVGLWFVRQSVRLLPPEQRARCREEWEADVIWKASGNGGNHHLTAMMWGAGTFRTAVFRSQMWRRWSRRYHGIWHGSRTPDVELSCEVLWTGPNASYPYVVLQWAPQAVLAEVRPSYYVVYRDGQLVGSDAYGPRHSYANWGVAPGTYAYQIAPVVGAVKGPSPSAPWSGGSEGPLSAPVSVVVSRT
jgi:hypothetical protein